MIPVNSDPDVQAATRRAHEERSRAFLGLFVRPSRPADGARRTHPRWWRRAGR